MFQQIKEWDVKIGKKIFHPVVIKLCHMLKCNQYRLSRDLWFMTFAGLAVYEVFIKNQGLAWWKLIILGLLFLSSAILKDTRSADNPFLRLFIWSFLIFDVVLIELIYFNKSDGVADIISDLLTNLGILLAEYAKTIDTIPPKEDKQKKSKEVYHESFVG